MKEYFSDNFFDELPDDFNLAIISICEEFFNLDKNTAKSADFETAYFEALEILRAYCMTKDHNIKVKSFSANSNENMSAIYEIFDYEYTNATVRFNNIFRDETFQKYYNKFKKDSEYSFSDKDYQRIQELINEMRDIVTESNIIEDKHKRRLLERLERMQKELHKHTSDLDRFGGLLVKQGL